MSLFLLIYPFPLHSRLFYSELQQPLPSQLNLPPRLPFLPSPPRRTNRNPLSQLHFLFYGIPCAGAVVWEVDAGEGAGAEVVCAARYNDTSIHQHTSIVDQDQG